MASEEWTDKTIRMPREDEHGPNGRIIVWHRYNGAMIANTYQLSENHFMRWWLPYPKPPKGAEKFLSGLDGPRVCNKDAGQRAGKEGKTK